MHRPHAGHETGPLEIPVRKHIEGIFPLTDRRFAGRLDLEILITIEKPHFFERNSECLSGHRAQVVGRELLPTSPPGEIDARFIHQAYRLQPDPLPPIQTYPGTKKGCIAFGINPPLAFMQWVSFRIGRKKPATVRAIEDKMPC